MASRPAIFKTIDFGPNGLVFKQPVRIQLPVGAAVMGKGSPIVQTYDYESGTWRKIKPVSINLVNGVVIAETQHFSTYVVVPDVKAFDLAVGLGNAGSACSDRLVVRAPLAVGFAELPASVVNGYDGAAATAADVLAGLAAGQALQVFIQVTARPASGDGEQSGWVLASATKQADGKVKVSVTSDVHADAFVATPLALAPDSPELAAWLNGSRVDFVFAALGAVAGGAVAEASASMYLVAAADADLPPPRWRTCSPARTCPRPRPRAASRAMQDCDGALDDWDPTPAGMAPPVVVGAPMGPLHVVVGGSTALKVVGPAPDATFSWGTSDPALVLTPDAGGLSATVRGMLPGQFRAFVLGEVGGASARFAWDVIVDPAAVQTANTPPVVAIAASASLVRVGEPVALSALAKDAEQATVTTTWSASDATTLVSVAGMKATFVATAPGDYVITCVGNDGFVSSAPAHVTISVLSATANRPPAVPAVSPMSPALQHEAGVVAKVDLMATSRDPDGDPITFEYAPDAHTPPTFTLVQMGANASFATTQNGTYVFYVTATDDKGAKSPWAPIKIQVLSPVSTMSVDTDKDGYPGGFDCNDNDPRIFPGAKEVCGDGVDQNCDGRDTPATECDLDGDRFSPAAGDCDDRNPAISPAALERCDGIDNNCNQVIDEGFDVGRRVPDRRRRLPGGGQDRLQRGVRGGRLRRDGGGARGRGVRRRRQRLQRQARRRPRRGRPGLGRHRQLRRLRHQVPAAAQRRRRVCGRRLRVDLRGGLRGHRSQRRQRLRVQAVERRRRDVRRPGQRLQRRHRRRRGRDVLRWSAGHVRDRRLPGRHQGVQRRPVAVAQPRSPPASRCATAWTTTATARSTTASTCSRIRATAAAAASSAPRAWLA